MAAPLTPGRGEVLFPSRIEVLPDLLEWFERHLSSSFDPMLKIQAQTALVEGFSNAVRHAHQGLAEPPPVLVSLTIDADSIELCIRDQGASFDIGPGLETAVPSSMERGVDGLPALLEREAHWGLIMLGKLRRDYGWTIRYDPQPEGGNLLLLQHPLPG
ncbi:ATP-binding protein [Cyanobium sp. Morenito 9A2]|uniref:ATP-binding protein n=1 Tax=Cyanobium sp. Morenito 9A2 TaxID=2823718 RepID=UPI0020CCDE7E|nr:ATP-binding protein [Cyanobium sp. Morenito 9A2]MCP9849454.1 ATP-binding protein [Cyanobium sp. Morenito 9A2]